MTFDKTGTLTIGKPQVTDLIPLGQRPTPAHYWDWSPVSNPTASIRWRGQSCAMHKRTGSTWRR
ncbi:MAG UNVERIFIED_CONTAM: hypothetical protein LVT10_09860 [Anaerolineae bacterium]